MVGDSALSSPTSPQTEQLVLFILCWSGFIIFLKQYDQHCHRERWWVVCLSVYLFLKWSFWLADLDKENLWLKINVCILPLSYWHLQ